ncbi:MAG: Lrp/AsnC family transcriptional regulator [Candidatus Woesearchaeota archaeon]
MNLDIKDKRILYALDKNARISYSQLARKTQLSPEVALYRVKKLEQSGIITQYQTSVNYWKLGLIHFKICLVFNGISLQAEEELYVKLKEIPQIIWIAKCQGEYDCLLSCTVNNMEELDSVKDKILALANKHLLNKTISLSSKIWSFPRRYLTAQKEELLEKEDHHPVELDRLDIELLRILSLEGRLSVVQIAKKLKSTIKIITNRIKKLQQSKTINNYRLVIDYEKLGVKLFKTFISLKNPENNRLRQLITYLNTNKHLVHNLKVIGAWDLEPEFEFEKEEEFQKEIQKIKNKFSDIIQKISVINVIKEYKYTFFYK